MQLSKSQKVLFAGGATFLTLVTGIGLHRASVHEQNCLSYENQAKATLNETLALSKEADGVLAQIQANPFAAFGFMAYPTQMMERTSKVKEKLNDTKYALVKTCGADRFNRFVSTPEVKLVVSQLEMYRDSIQNRANAFGG